MNNVRIRVRVAAGEGSETKLMKLAGISAVVHVVGLIVVSFLPRLLTSPPPPVSMVAEIVPASALFPPSPAPAGPTPPSGPTPTQRAKEALKAQQKPPAEKPPPKPVPKKDTTVPPLESKKDSKKKEPVKPQPPSPPVAETKTPEEASPPMEKNGDDANGKDEPKGPAPGAGISFGSSAGFDASGVPTLGSSAFPYDYYRSTLMTLLQSNWRRPVLTDSLAEPLRCGIGFTILKSGVVKDAHVADPSGNAGLDRSALRAVIDSNPLPPLPFQYGHDAVSAVVYFKLTGD